LEISTKLLLVNLKMAWYTPIP